MKRILVTGAGGFIGGFVVEEAVKRDFKTWAGVRSSTNKKYLTQTGAEFIELDFSNENHLQEQLSEFKQRHGRWDCIIHNMGVTKCSNPMQFDLINHQYTKRFVETLVRLEMQPSLFIYMSSISAGLEINLDGNNIDCQPETEYGWSKLRAEDVLKSIPGFPYLIFRPTGVYGPRETDYLQFYKAISRGLNVQAGGQPQQLTFIYIKDLINVIFLAMEKRVIGKTFLLSDGNTYSSKQWSQYVLQSMGRKQAVGIHLPLWLLATICSVGQLISTLFNVPIVLNKDKYRLLKRRTFECDSTPVMRELGFQPCYFLERGIHETIQWCKEEKWL